MKKSIKLTLGLLGISTISAITIGSVISCSNNNTNLASNNNQDNKNSNNKSSSTNPNSSNNTSFIPYSELTKTVTKEPSFAAALANWTQRWKQLTSNSETYLKMITNDFNACLSLTTNFINNNPDDFFDNDAGLSIGHGVLLHISFSNIQILLNKNNTFNISYDYILDFGYIKNNISYPNVFTVQAKDVISNLSFSPYLFTKNLSYYFYSATKGIMNPVYVLYAGECISSGKFDVYVTNYVINHNEELSNAPNWLIEKSKAFNILKISNTNPEQNFIISKKYYDDISFIWPIFLGWDAIDLISSYQNGINYGEFSFPNNI